MAPLQDAFHGANRTRLHRPPYDEAGHGVMQERTLQVDIPKGIRVGQPTVERPAWRFGGEALARARRIRRLQRDFVANLQSVAVMLGLIDEVERLRARIGPVG